MQITLLTLDLPHRKQPTHQGLYPPQNTLLTVHLTRTQTNRNCATIKLFETNKENEFQQTKGGI